MAGRFKVGDWTIAPELNCLERDGQTVHVEPKVMQVLVMLAEHPGDVVPKEQIFHRVWPGTFVGDEVLTRSVSELRKVFADNPREPAYIQTIPKSGYRLVAPVVEAPPEAVIPRQGSWSKQNKLFVILSGVVLLGGLGYYYVAGRYTNRAEEPRIKSLAVLPLSNLSGDSSQEYFVDGLSDELTTRLSNISNLRVISRASAMHYKGTTKTTPEIARELKVDAVLEGSVVRSGDRVRISTQLIQAEKDKNLWARSYDRDLRDVLALQAEIAGTVAEEIKVRVDPHETQKLRGMTGTNPAAYDAYLKGNYYWEKFTPDGMRRAIDYYQQAIEIDPNYAPAYAGLADAYHESFDRPPKEVIPKAKAALQKALQLDQDLAEAHSSSGWVKWIYDWDWSGAESEFKRAIQLNPNYAGAHGMYAEYLDSAGRFHEAQSERTITMELSPIDPILYANSGEHFFYTRQYDQAIRSFHESLELDSNFLLAHWWLAQVYGVQGTWSESIRHLSQFATLAGDDALAANIKAAYAKGGQRSAMRVMLDKNRLLRSRGQWVSSAEDTFFYLMLNENASAIQAMARAVEERDPNVVTLRVDPAFDAMRSEPQFQRLIRQVGLPQ